MDFLTKLKVNWRIWWMTQTPFKATFKKDGEGNVIIDEETKQPVVENVYLPNPKSELRWFLFWVFVLIAIFYAIKLLLNKIIK